MPELGPLRSTPGAELTVYLFILSSECFTLVGYHSLMLLSGNSRTIPLAPSDPIFAEHPTPKLGMGHSPESCCHRENDLNDRPVQMYPSYSEFLEDAYEEDEPFEHENSHEHLDSVEVSLNSVIGLASPRTMKIRGSIRDIEVVVLIDCGATHNFVSRRLIEMAGLVVSDLGEMVVNWKELTMAFGEGDKRVSIKCDPALSRSLVSLKSMVRTMHVQNVGFLIELNIMEIGKLLPYPSNDNITDVLEEFDDIFHLPYGLATHRDHEHSIQLKEGTQPISVRPYRYPHVQKDETERNIREPLDNGFLLFEEASVVCKQIDYLGYYREFVRGYGKIAWVLTEQLKKDSFIVVKKQLKRHGIGAVLMQGGRPAAYYSQTLGSRAQLKSVCERELMAIVFAIQKWRPNLLGRRFIVRADQRSLKYLLEQRLIMEEYKKWPTKLMGYDFDIQYKAGIDTPYDSSANTSPLKIVYGSQPTNACI
ncbi:putative mitochondrial protein [Tanacetum coccineum]